MAMVYDDHNPPHFHAEYGEHEVLVSISTLAILSGSLPARALGLVTEWASLHLHAARPQGSRRSPGRARAGAGATDRPYRSVLVPTPTRRTKNQEVAVGRHGTGGVPTPLSENPATGEGAARGHGASAPPRRECAYFVNASAPALATCASCSDVAPDTPTAPTTFPSTRIGMPPSSGLAPLSLNSRRLEPPWPTRSWNTLVGRR